jgi:signal transduction histidine kinase
MSPMRLRNLSFQIYATIIVALIAVVLLAGLTWRRSGDRLPVRQAFEVAGELASLALAPAAAAPDEQDRKLKELATRLGLDLALFDTTRTPIATAGKTLPAPPAEKEDSGWIYGPEGRAWAVALPDGRWLVAHAPRRPAHVHPAVRLIGFLAAIAGVVALAAYPIVRGLARRIERLQAGVERLGSGDLKARVAVEGRDEVADLAQSFNRSAERIEALVASQKMLLANVSHELRTPLARVRLGIELIAREPTPARRAALERDIAELDQLIDELLTASRLESLPELPAKEAVELLALAAEECAHYPGASAGGTPVTVTGDPRLLRRLVRNLVDNAMKHGAPPIEVEVGASRGRAEITVTDHGPGIPAADRERVFEPFQRGHGASGASGSGLGLALVRQIARRHGGDAAFDAAASGNRITVWLPVVAV